MENIIKEIQSMLISQFGYPWNVEYDSSVATVSMVCNVREHGIEYKMNAEFIIDH